MLLHAIDKLAERVLSRLGESLGSIARADRPIVQVSTSSRDALNSFTQGMTRWQEGKYKEAAALMEMALELDIGFVDARGSLALLKLQFLGDPENGKELLRQALQDAEAQDLPQRDVLKLKAGVKQFVEGDLPGALEQYQVMQGLTRGKLKLKRDIAAVSAVVSGAVEGALAAIEQTGQRLEVRRGGRAHRPRVRERVHGPAAPSWTGPRPISDLTARKRLRRGGASCWWTTTPTKPTYCRCSWRATATRWAAMNAAAPPSPIQ